MYRCHIDSLTQNFQDAKTATEAGLAKFPAGALRRIPPETPIRDSQF